MTIASYLEKWSSFYFSGFAREWIGVALDGWGEGRDLFLSDVICKYPDSEKAGDLDSAMVDILETDTTIEASFYHRLARSIFLRDSHHPSLRFFAHLMKVKTQMEIYYSTAIGPRFRIEHGMGTVIGPRSRIGSDFTVHQGVTLGQRRMFAPDNGMTIGDHCVVFAGAAILGAVTLGDRVAIAANAVMLSDGEAGATYAGAPAVKIKRREQP